jgi:hypothetical protein
VAQDQRRWLSAVAVSAALLFVPFVGFVLLFILPGGTDDDEADLAGLEVVDVIGAPSAKRSAATRAGSRGNEMQRCCNALRQRSLGADTHLQRIYADAAKSCNEAMKADDPEEGLRAARSVVQGARAEFPVECE